MASGRIWRLDAGDDTLVFAADVHAPARLIYWGAPLDAACDLAAMAALAERAVPHGMLDAGEKLNLLPERGQGFTGRPALELARDDGRFITQLALIDCVCDGRQAAFTLADAQAGVSVVQTLRLHPSGVLIAQAEIVNDGDDSLTLARLAPIALPVSHACAHHFSGRWTNEWQINTAAIGEGAWLSENRTGRTSHHAPPFVLLSDAGAGEDHGRWCGAHLGWSGDHDLLIQRLRDGRVQLQMAQLLLPNEIRLPPGGRFCTAPLYVARSDEGCNGVSAKLHTFVRAELLAPPSPRLVHFNTWEAAYFAHDEARLKDLAGHAAALGAERFVLDDGWFKGRHHDRAGLGDWTPDPAKYPNGLAPLADHVRSLGMQFGLWFEPECVNADSDLFRAHPDWVQGEAGRDQPLGRNQLILDLTRDAVSESLFAAIDAALRDTGARYIKWDFNRDSAHPAANGNACGVNQIHALYRLLDRVRAAHPAVEIEACASGGARADYAMLSRCARIWVSDCNDPFDRQRQQRAFSVFFPPEVMGAHVGPAVAHTTGRSARIDTRALTAMFGHLGVEADPTALKPKERDALVGFIALYKQWRGFLHAGRLQRLDLDDPGLIAFAVWRDNEALVSVAQVATPRFAAPSPLRLPGFNSNATVYIETMHGLAHPAAAMKTPPDWAQGAPRTGPGALLAREGLPLPVLRVGDIVVYRLVLTHSSPPAHPDHP